MISQKDTLLSQSILIIELICDEHIKPNLATQSDDKFQNKQHSVKIT